MNLGIRALSIAAMSFITLTSCTFIAPSVDEAKATLEEAGYTVYVNTGDKLDEDNSDSLLYNVIGVDDAVYGAKESDEIYLIYFFSIETASSEGDFITTPDGMRKGQINKLVYIGTPQAIKDAKL